MHPAFAKRSDFSVTVSSSWKNFCIKKTTELLNSNHSANQFPPRCGVVQKETVMALPPRRRAAAQTKQSILASVNGNLALFLLIVGGLVNTGVMYQQFAQVKQNQEIQSADQKALNAKLTEISNKQIGGLQDISTLKTNVQALDSGVRNLDGRVLVIERTFIEPAKRGK